MTALKIVFTCLASFFMLTAPAQEKEIRKEIKKEVKVIRDTDKAENVSVNVNENDGKKTLVIKITDQDGKEEVIDWEGEGEIPAEIMERMEQMDINIDMDDDAHDGHRTIIIHSDDESDDPDDMDIKIIKSNGDYKIINELEEIVENEGSSSVHLGIRVYEIAGDEGIEVVEVIKDSPADKVSIQPGDIIISIDGASISSASDIKKAINEKNHDDTIKIETLRNGQKRMANIILKSRIRTF